MANTKSALKANRQNVVHRERNRTVRSRLRTLAKKRKAASGDDVVAVNSEFHSALDKAAKRGIIHPNKASRLKSRSSRAKSA